MLEVVVVLLYFLPLGIAALFKHKKLLHLGLLNVLFGWFIVCWIAALIWAFVGPHKEEEE